MNNPLQPTPDVTEMRMALILRCIKNEYDEDTLVNYVELVDDEYAADLENHGINGAGMPTHTTTLPVPPEMAELFIIGKDYQVEVKVTIPDRAFTPFVRTGGTETGRM